MGRGGIENAREATGTNRETNGLDGMTFVFAEDDASRRLISISMWWYIGAHLRRAVT